MNEVKKCSISGVAFTLDNDAYATLGEYLDSLKKNYEGRPEGDEIVADIEARIAELILSTQDSTRVVGRPLILNIIRQMGSAEDIAAEDTAGQPESKVAEHPRIPRRLYRDTENAKLGGVCAGIGRYFDIDPAWVRLAMFAPILLSFFQQITPLYWMGQLMGNMFGIFVICYLVMWFAVPAARTARQKLEMTGEKITAQSIEEATVAAASSSDPDAKARPIIAEAVSVFGRVVLLCMKMIAALIIFGLVMCACGLIITLIGLIFNGTDLISPPSLAQYHVLLPISGILVVLIPVLMLVYVFMCLVASHKPSGKALLFTFLLWMFSLVGCATMVIREGVVDDIRHNAIQISNPVSDSHETSLETLRQMLDDHEMGG